MAIHSSTPMETLQMLLAQQLERSPEEIRPETKLADIDLDSLARIDLALSLERCFDCQFEEGKVLKWRTVQDIVAAIEEA